MAADTPRIAPLPAGEWDEGLAPVLERLPGGPGEPLHIFSTLARADRELFRRWLGFGGALLNGTLPGRLRELVILRTAYRFGGGYEWAQHIALGEAEGLSRAEISLLGGFTEQAGGSAEQAGGSVVWSPLERAALDAVDETKDAGVVSDPTWTQLEAHLSESEIIELLLLIAHYEMLTSVLRSLRVQLEPRAEALARRVPGGPDDLWGVGGPAR